MSNSPFRIRHHIYQNIKAYNLWKPGDNVLVSVSGGRDSVVLLDLLHYTNSMHKGNISVITINHGTRIDSADDATFVQELSKKYGYDCIRVDGSLGKNASEEVCRELRQEAWASVVDADVIVTAHHQRDQAETVLMHMMRGAGTRGMAGMRWKNGKNVKPLLNIPYENIVAWSEERNLEWREDSTNSDPKYLRNRIRNEVLPLLESIRPGSIRNLATGASYAAEDENLLSLLKLTK